MMVYKEFNDWFLEIENYGTRSERFYESLESFQSEQGRAANGIMWLQAAFDAGRSELQNELNRKNILAGAEIHSGGGYSEGSYDHPDFREIQARHHALYNASPCACMGPQGDDPHCPCTMRTMGLEPTKQMTEEKHQELARAMKRFYDDNNSR
jgi:hypothetical protein